ncbi:MAG: hypothetical protein ACJ8FI_13515 [Sphingomicrobium sp.]
MNEFQLFWPTGEISVFSTILRIVLAIVVAALAGYFFKKLALRFGGRGQRTERMDSQENFLVSGVLVLLALMLAFTTGFVVELYDQRRLLVVEEGNAIGTAYLRSQALDEPHRTRLSNLLVAYTDNRIALSVQPGDRRALLAENDRLLTYIWAAVLAANDSARDKGISTPLYLAFNEVVDLDTERKIARLSRVPEGILMTLYTFLVVTAGILGAVLDGARQRVVAGILFMLLTLAVAMIVDLNRPTRGSIRESQQALLLLRDSMKVPRSDYDRYR